MPRDCELCQDFEAACALDSCDFEGKLSSPLQNSDTTPAFRNCDDGFEVAVELLVAQQQIANRTASDRVIAEGDVVAGVEKQVMTP